MAHLKDTEQSINDTDSEFNSQSESGDINSDEGTINTSKTTTSKATGPRQVVNNAYTTGFPIAKDRVKLKVMIRDHNNGAVNYENNLFKKYIEDKLNVTLEFIPVAPTDAVGEQMTLAYVSGNMPDMFWGMAPTGYPFHQPYINQGKVLALDQYIDKYGPNIKKMFKEVPQAQYLSTADDGKIYMLPKVSLEDNFEDKIYINKTWLKKVNKPMPTTTEEFRNVLIAFRDNDPNGNGKKDEIPFAMCGDISPSLYSSFGVSTYLDYLTVDDKGKVQYVPLTDGYRQALIFYRNLHSEKLLYENFRGLTLGELKTMANATVPMVGAMMALDYYQILTPERFMSDYTIVPPLKASKTGKPLWGYTVTENIWADWFLVTSKCKYPEIAVRIADYLYSVEGTAVALYGPPGANNAWNLDNKGNYVPNYSKTPKGKTLYEWSCTLTPGYPIPHYTGKEYLDFIEYVSPNPTNEEKASMIQKQLIKQYFVPAKPKNILHKVNFTTSEMNQLKDLGNYQKTAWEMRWNFIGGDSSLENDWDAYVANLNRLGASKMVAIRQNAHNRYLVWHKNNVK